MTPATPSLDLYRTAHRIEVDDSRALPVCRTDGIRIVPTRRHWRHDPGAIDRLRTADFRPLYRPIEGYRSEIEDDGLGQAKAADEAREDAFTNGRLTFDWR